MKTDTINKTTGSLSTRSESGVDDRRLVGPVVSVGRRLEFFNADCYPVPREGRLVLVVKTRVGDYSLIGRVTDEGAIEDEDGNDCGYTLDGLSYWAHFRSPYDDAKFPSPNDHGQVVPGTKPTNEK